MPTPDNREIQIVPIKGDSFKDLLGEDYAFPPSVYLEFVESLAGALGIEAPSSWGRISKDLPAITLDVPADFLSDEFSAKLAILGVKLREETREGLASTI